MSKVIKLLQNYQFTLVRCLTGIYFSYYFGSLFEQRELLREILQSHSFWIDFLTGSLPLVGLLASLSLLVGIGTPLAAALVLFCYHLGYFSLPLPREVQASYLTLVLLSLVCFASRKPIISSAPLRLDEKGSWRLFMMLAVYLGYSVSGLSKLFYPAWLNGEAMNYFCSASQITNAFGKTLCTFLPMNAGGYFVLFVEIMALPLAAFKGTRLLSWTLTTTLHLLIPTFMYVWPVSAGVLIMQLLLFDFRWLKRLK